MNHLHRVLEAATVRHLVVTAQLAALVMIPAKTACSGRGQSERGGATHHEWNTHDDAEQVYEPVLHHWRTEQPNDFTRHEWNMGTGVDRSWGDGRVYYDDRGDFAEENTGYGRRTSWDTTTANSTSDGRPRRARDEDPWTTGNDPWQRATRQSWSHAGTTTEYAIREASEEVPGQMVET